MLKPLPYKSTAIGLILCVILGPIGLLYGSLGGGIVLLLVGCFIALVKAWHALIVLWLVCCVWSASAVDTYNARLLQVSLLRGTKS